MIFMGRMKRNGSWSLNKRKNHYYYVVYLFSTICLIRSGCSRCPSEGTSFGRIKAVRSEQKDSKIECKGDDKSTIFTCNRAEIIDDQ